jgi:hypothetical protein
MAAAGQTQILPGDPHPLEVLGGGQHSLDELAVLVLHPRPLDKGGARLGDAVREAVANHLQLTEVEDAGSDREGVDPVRHLGMAERLAEEPAQLGLEPGDLTAQFEPCIALVNRDTGCLKGLLE